jgi:hypothetical protein
MNHFSKRWTGALALGSLLFSGSAPAAEDVYFAHIDGANGGQITAGSAGGSVLNPPDDACKILFEGVTAYGWGTGYSGGGPYVGEGGVQSSIVVEMPFGGCPQTPSEVFFNGSYNPQEAPAGATSIYVEFSAASWLDQYGDEIEPPGPCNDCVFEGDLAVEKPWVPLLPATQLVADIGRTLNEAKTLGRLDVPTQKTLQQLYKNALLRLGGLFEQQQNRARQHMAERELDRFENTVVELDRSLGDAFSQAGNLLLLCQTQAGSIKTLAQAINSCGEAEQQLETAAVLVNTIDDLLGIPQGAGEQSVFCGVYFSSGEHPLNLRCPMTFDCTTGQSQDISVAVNFQRLSATTVTPQGWHSCSFVVDLADSPLPIPAAQCAQEVAAAIDNNCSQVTAVAANPPAGARIDIYYDPASNAYLNIPGPESNATIDN